MRTDSWTSLGYRPPHHLWAVLEYGIPLDGYLSACSVRTDFFPTGSVRVIVITRQLDVEPSQERVKGVCRHTTFHSLSFSALDRELEFELTELFGFIQTRLSIQHTRLTVLLIMSHFNKLHAVNR
jgi:hypothetical protein